MTDTVTPQELQSLLDAGSALLLDVRRQADYAANPRIIPGAQWKNPEDVQTWAAEIPPERPVIIYCVRGGSVSAGVQQALRARNIDARYLQGGLAAWDATI